MNRRMTVLATLFLALTAFAGQPAPAQDYDMLSWATESLLEDGLSQSDIRQGVTLEVMG